MSRPVFSRMKNARDHDCFPPGLIEDKMAAELRHHESADLSVSGRNFADAPPEFTVVRQHNRGIEYNAPNAFRGFGIVRGHVVTVIIQIVHGLRTEPSPDHVPRRNSSDDFD